MAERKERLGAIARWLQQADEEIEYAPDADGVNVWLLEIVSRGGTLVDMAIVADVLYIAVVFEAGREYWATRDGASYSLLSHQELMAVAPGMIPQQKGAV